MTAGQACLRKGPGLDETSTLPIDQETQADHAHGDSRGRHRYCRTGRRPLAASGNLGCCHEPGGIQCRGRAETAEWPAAREQADLGKRDPGQPEQRAGPAAAVSGRGRRQAGLVRPARRVRRRRRTRPERELRTETGQHRNQRPGRSTDRHTRLADPGAESVRASGREVRRRPGLQPHPDRRARTHRLPARQIPAGGGSRTRLQPVHPHRRLNHRLQRADRRDRQRPIRCHPPNQHRTPGARRPHRGQAQARTVRGVVGRPAVREGLRRRPADRLPQHRCGPAADRGARAVHLRARPHRRSRSPNVLVPQREHPLPQFPGGLAGPFRARPPVGEQAHLPGAQHWWPSDARWRWSTRTGRRPRRRACPR